MTHEITVVAVDHPALGRVHRAICACGVRSSGVGTPDAVTRSLVHTHLPRAARFTWAEGDLVPLTREEPSC